MSKNISKWARKVWEHSLTCGDPITPEHAALRFGAPMGAQTAAELLGAAARAGWFRREHDLEKWGKPVASKAMYLAMREPVIYTRAKKQSTSDLDGLMFCNSIFDLGARYAKQNSRNA